jgi:tRNA-dihydrouridine synthase 2
MLSLILVARCCDHCNNPLSEMEDVVTRLYSGKECLAPMVRAGTLPFRLLALEYGADTVWGEEVVDRRMSSTTRIVNERLGTIDYVNGNSLAFRTCAQERDRVIFQIGSSSAAFALAAAQLVERDVAAIDLNMGCPKRFSTQVIT